VRASVRACVILYSRHCQFSGGAVLGVSEGCAQVFKNPLFFIGLLGQYWASVQVAHYVSGGRFVTSLVRGSTGRRYRLRTMKSGDKECF
jgi:hypothetical protein